MLITIQCADCKTKLGSFVKLGLKRNADVDVEIHACFHRSVATLRDDILETLTWMVADMKWRADETMGNIEEGSSGGYSPELQKAIDLLEFLQKDK